MKPVEFVIHETDDTLVTHSGLALIGALLGRTKIARRANALALESKPRPETAHADVLLSMIGLLSAVLSSSNTWHPALPCVPQGVVIKDCEDFRLRGSRGQRCRRRETPTKLLGGSTAEVGVNFALLFPICFATLIRVSIGRFR